MLQRIRPRLSYANVMATVAVLLALGGGAIAATHLRKNSVTSRTIKNGQVKSVDLANNAVTSPKIADGAVTNSKLAANAVDSSKIAPDSISGLKDIQDGTVQGSDIIENTLNFGCRPTPDIVSATGSVGPVQVGSTGFCGFVIPTGSHTWAQAAAACTGIVPDSTLPSAAELEEYAQAAGNQAPPTGTTGIWLDSPSGTSAAWTASVGNDAHVSTFASTPLTTSSSGPVVCVYQPASKQG